FFTTKDKGLGLGLALCHRIIEEHRGAIQIASEPGRGTTVSCYLPIAR
ncbi:MAG TPA: ATP-binding protein, partial [Methylomirabilota bacterium]|nr:ATP-binding protein [Methylomirabilota bacterium]